MIDTRLLKEQRFFADLTDDELGIISSITHKKDFKLGETAFKTSEEGQSLYLIRSGEVKVCLEAPDGEIFTLTILKDGDIFYDIIEAGTTLTVSGSQLGTLARTYTHKN